MTDRPPALGRQKTPEAYRRAQTVAEGFLVGIAQSRRVVTYAELGDTITAATDHKIDGRTFGQFLGDLVESTYPRYGVMLSSVVVRSDDFAPGEGFGLLADALKLRKPGEDDVALTHRLRAATWRAFDR